MLAAASPAAPFRNGRALAIAAALAGAPIVWAAALVPLTWIGTTTGNFGALDMGRVAVSRTQLELAPGARLAEGPPGVFSGIWWPQWRRDVLGMTLHGVLSAILPEVWVVALALWLHGVTWHAVLGAAPAATVILLAGLAAAPGYELGYQISRYRGPMEGWGRDQGPRWLNGATQFGELFWGIAMGVGTLWGAWLAIAGSG